MQKEMMKLISRDTVGDFTFGLDLSLADLT